MSWNNRHLLTAVVAGLAVAIAAAPAAAQREITLHSFTLQNGDGAQPAAGIRADRRGNLFGTTWYGGINSCGGGAGCGTIFKTSPAGGGHWTTATLYSFTDTDDGGYPSAPLAVDGTGTLYGALGNHTNAPGGSVFALVPANGSWSFETLYAFQNTGDGQINTYSPVLVDHGKVYGVTWTGGSGNCQSGCGTLFRLAPPKSGGLPWVYTALFSFPGGDGRSLPVCIAGSGQKDTVYVATGDDNGAVVGLSASQAPGSPWRETVLYSFAGGRDGGGPNDLIVGSDGTIYGTAGFGGQGGGLVFSLTPRHNPGSGWARTTLYRDKHFFHGPTSLALGPDGTIVGTEFGEIDAYAGNVFELSPATGQRSGWTYNKLYKFNRGPSRDPMNAIFGKGGHLYGVLNGGDSDNGAVFEIR